MIKIARKLALSLILIACPAMASDPAGVWAVKDGTAHIRILPCNGALWGAISWVQAPGNDDKNPDPAKRSRSVLGMPILLHMQPEGDKWNGDIYNADNGKTYSGSIRLKSDDVLNVQGCVLGVLCGGEDWTRLHPGKAEEKPDMNCDEVTKP